MAAGAGESKPGGTAMPYGSVLTTLAAADPERVALVCDGPGGSVQLTRGELEAWANRLARAYAELGLSSGDFATIALPNGPEFFAACLAIWKLGAVPNPVSHRLPPPERAAIIERANPALVIGLAQGSYAGCRCIPAHLAVDAYAPEPLEPRTSPHERAMASGGSTGLLNSSWRPTPPSTMRSALRRCSRAVTPYWCRDRCITAPPSAPPSAVCSVVAASW
ncbi:MAG: class I adenylate-forming enzyme family protein [Halioglobus sp.]